VHTFHNFNGREGINPVNEPRQMWNGGNEPGAYRPACTSQQVHATLARVEASVPEAKIQTGYAIVDVFDRIASSSSTAAREK
jgi:hypothetical protein